jgi:hypothetical protein
MKARDNPFAVDRVLRVRYELSDVALSQLAARFETLGYRAAIVGPHGSGKTTLLEDLEAPLARRGFRVVCVRLDADHPRFGPGVLASLSAHLNARDIVCIDGAEQLAWPSWMMVRWRTRRAGGLLVTSHRRGRLPTLLECTTSPALLERIIERLMPSRGREAGAPPAGELFARHRGNLRDALRELYDVYAAVSD